MATAYDCSPLPVCGLHPGFITLWAYSTPETQPLRSTACPPESIRCRQCALACAIAKPDQGIPMTRSLFAWRETLTEIARAVRETPRFSGRLTESATERIASFIHKRMESRKIGVSNTHPFTNRFLHAGAKWRGGALTHRATQDSLRTHRSCILRHKTTDRCDHRSRTADINGWTCV